jgi:hypothetical protein
MHRRRTLIYAALALAVPFPAFALSGGDSPSASSTLSVGASLDECGIAASSVVCKIDASWNDVAGAERYTASVTSPDGAVTDYGDVTGTSTSVWVPYVGNGTYTVTVSAWGTPPGADKPEIIAKERAGTGATGHATKPHTSQSFSNEPSPTGTSDGSDSGTDPVQSEPTDDPPPECDPPAAENATASAEAATDAAESAVTIGEDCPDLPDPGTTTSTTSTTTTPTTPAPDGG